MRPLENWNRNSTAPGQLKRKKKGKQLSPGGRKIQKGTVSKVAWNKDSTCMKNLLVCLQKGDLNIFHNNWSVHGQWMDIFLFDIQL